MRSKLLYILVFVSAFSLASAATNSNAGSLESDGVTSLTCEVTSIYEPSVDGKYVLVSKNRPLFRFQDAFIFDTGLETMLTNTGESPWNIISPGPTELGFVATRYYESGGTMDVFRVNFGKEKHSFVWLDAYLISMGSCDREEN